jgi:hypothetical protein
MGPILSQFKPFFTSTHAEESSKSKDLCDIL